MGNDSFGIGNERQGITNANQRSNSNICFTCANAYGGCEWTAVDRETDKIRFEPVPGWTAEKTLLNMSNYKQRRIVESYHIIDCPKHTPHRRS